MIVFYIMVQSIPFTTRDCFAEMFIVITMTMFSPIAVIPSDAGVGNSQGTVDFSSNLFLGVIVIGAVCSVFLIGLMILCGIFLVYR